MRITSTESFWDSHGSLMVLTVPVAAILWLTTGDWIYPIPIFFVSHLGWEIGNIVRERREKKQKQDTIH